MYRIYPASPKAQAMCPEGFDNKPDAFRPLDPEKNSKEYIYPFRRLAVGTCFVVPYSEFTKSGPQTLRSVANSAMRIMEGRKFKVIMHDNENVAEVARIL